MTTEQKPVCCPHCNEKLAFDLVSQLMQESRMSFSVSPHKGERLSAHNVGGMLTNLDKLMVAIGKDLGVKTSVLLDGVESDDDGSFKFNLIIARHEPGVKSRKA